MKTRKKISGLSFLLMLLYGVIIIYFTLFSDRLGRLETYENFRYNLIPFFEIRRFIMYRHLVSTGAFILNICGNLLVFFPLGFLIPLWISGIRWNHALFCALCFSLCIELCQLVFRVGVFDIDDLIMNTLGGLMGFITYKIFYVLYRVGRRLKKL